MVDRDTSVAAQEISDMHPLAKTDIDHSNYSAVRIAYCVSECTRYVSRTISDLENHRVGRDAARHVPAKGRTRSLAKL